MCKLTLCSDTRATPILDWDSVPDAGLYMVYLSYDGKLTNLVYGNKADPKTIPWTQNTRWNPLAALAESQAGDAYYWYVRPCKAIGACAPEPTEAKFAFQKKSLEVVPEPIKDLSNGEVANEVTFSWKDYLDTNLASTNPKTGERINQAAQSYHVQVATNSAFSKPVDDVVVDQTTYTAFSKTYPEGTLYWRVQAIDGSGNGLTWSPAWKFVKRSPPRT